MSKHTFEIEPHDALDTVVGTVRARHTAIGVALALDETWNWVTAPLRKGIAERLASGTPSSSDYEIAAQMLHHVAWQLEEAAKPR